jgi:hypothetical protein
LPETKSKGEEEEASASSAFLVQSMIILKQAVYNF